ncbi:uncharacterized protein LOC118436634 [Folsomia candida]|uniref:uncharacterized protein LOC118436634 n=1 Tax=Folsomia candida TaxID=158441 RepID=UPI001604C058|nr:uncharacterized protein LOC118436634 [Folsomia candida]
MADKRNSKNEDDGKRKSGEKEPPRPPNPDQNVPPKSDAKRSSDDKKKEPKRVSLEEPASTKNSDESESAVGAGGTLTTITTTRHHHHHRSHHKHHRHGGGLTTETVTKKPVENIVATMSPPPPPPPAIPKLLRHPTDKPESVKATDSKRPRRQKPGQLPVAPGKTVLSDDDQSEVDSLAEPASSESGFLTSFRRASTRVINALGILESKTDEILMEEEQKDKTDSVEDIGLPFLLLDKSTMKMLNDDDEDVQIAADLSEVLAHYKGEFSQEEKAADPDNLPDVGYEDIVKMLKSQGIPIPTDSDFSKLESSYSQKWDPDGTVVEYYSPVLRSFIPINMRGRYRGCWLEDHCVQGLDISKIKPKPDALEGFVDQGRTVNIDEKYQEMFDVADDGAHLDYLIEMQKCQAETLPIPIMYDVVNFGVDVLKENLEYLVHHEAIPPTSRIYQTTENHLLNMRKKVQIYASLGLEPISSDRTDYGMEKVSPMWRLTRDEIIAILLEKRHEPDDFDEKVKIVAEMYAEEEKRTGKKLVVEDGDNDEENTAYAQDSTTHKKKEQRDGGGGGGADLLPKNDGLSPSGAGISEKSTSTKLPKSKKKLVAGGGLAKGANSVKK